MTKEKINAFDVSALLSTYQMEYTLKEALKAKKILCISDTHDLFPTQGVWGAVAENIRQAKLGPDLEVIQSDFKDYSPDFGTHLPQQKHETRKEYMKVDAKNLKEDLSKIDNIDVVLGRNCMCACSKGELCGGIGRSVEAQEVYLETLLEKGPSLIVLSANWSNFTNRPSEQPLYKEAQKNLSTVCENLNKNSNSPYLFQLIKLAKISSNPYVESGYMLVAYDSNKVKFELTTFSLETRRIAKKELISYIDERQKDTRDFYRFPFSGFSYSRADKLKAATALLEIMNKNYSEKNSRETDTATVIELAQLVIDHPAITEGDLSKIYEKFYQEVKSRAEENPKKRYDPKCLP